MPQPILVGYDAHKQDRAPVNFGVAAARFTGAPLIVVSVHTGTAGLGAAAGAAVEEERESEGSLEHLRAELGAEGVDVEVRSIAGTSAPHALHDAAEKLDAGLLVVGSTDRGTRGRLLPGSTAQRLMHGAPCPIAVIPHGWAARGTLATIGVAFVQTPEGQAALENAVALARRAHARLRVLSAAKPRGYGQTYGGGDAMSPPTRFEDVGSEVRVATERAVDAATADDRDVEIEPDVSVGDPADFLIAASENLDLLVCGSRGYGPTRAVLLGGVSRRVTAEAHCPVIVLVRGPEAGLSRLIGEQSEAVG